MPHHLLHIHDIAPHAGGVDWLSILLGLAAIVAILGFAGGLSLALNYGLQASTSLTAEATTLVDGGFLLAVRPVVKGVGPTRVRMTKPAKVRVTQVGVVPNTDAKPDEGKFWENDKVFELHSVEPGEELGTTVLFRLKPGPAELVGWSIELSVHVKKRWWAWRAPIVWSNRIFQPAPSGGAPVLVTPDA
jgi:hypothetical protein